MEIKIAIKESQCIKCGKCVKVCPSMVLAQSQPQKEVEPIAVENCIGCGHCVAACPNEAVDHSLFPLSKVHVIDYGLYPTPEQMILLTKARRSNRAFSKQAIPLPYLEQIAQAAYRAPTASNMQQMGFTIITNPEQLRAITEFTIGVFDAMLHKMENPLLKPLLRRLMPGVYRYVQIFNRIKDQYATGNDMILRRATAVLLIHTAESNRFGIEDANLAYQNGSLMAECLGVSQFYTGFVLSAIKQDKKHNLEKILGIEGKIVAGMALGMPLFRFQNYIDRKDINLTIK